MAISTTAARAAWVVLAGGVLLGGALATPADEPASGQGRSPAEQAALARAETAVGQLGTELKGKLLEAMGSGGAPAAVAVCADEAQAITAEVAAASGGRVGRSSLRLRNPANAPPAWVRAWLDEQGERPFAGVERQVSWADADDGAVVRVIQPLQVQGPCFTCHGAPASIPVAVRAVLDERYPDDRATGYVPGDLRGAIWAEFPVVDGAGTEPPASPAPR